MYHICCINNLDSQKAKAGIKVGESRKRRSRTEASIKASEERASKYLEGSRREEDGKQFKELKKLMKSIGAIAHLRNP